MNHNPNPFDFVPFAKEDPVLKTPEEWLALGNLRTGRITVEMKALTPVHIVGEQPMNGMNIEKSLFYQRNGKYFIPGSSIRGVLRGFIEAACNGWASQLTPYYQKEHKRHTYGFKVVKSETPEDAKTAPFLSNTFSIDQKFCVPSTTEQGIDLASFLFGHIPGKTEDKNLFNPAWKGRVMIDDAEVAESQLSSVKGKNIHEIPDLKDSRAFMGGPHPSASSWWYQFPKEIRIDEYGAYRFIGSELRGRKFYFHQNPKECTKIYFNNLHQWNLLHHVPIQCVEKGNIVSIEIFFKDVPEILLQILYFALEPGKRIRHKIGYGKAYGYGSVEFSIRSITCKCKGFEDSSPIDLYATRKSLKEQIITFNDKDENSIARFLHKPSLDDLSFILWYEESFKNTYTYPCPGEGGFNVCQKGEARKDYNKELGKAVKKTLSKYNLNVDEMGVIKILPSQAKKIAIDLHEIKPALDFELYQEKSELKKGIKEKRRFNCD
jgi:CRISPR/Cas system CSM-associated protein Csm3 (group 7 of RAMP superfamily)